MITQWQRQQRQQSHWDCVKLGPCSVGLFALETGIIHVVMLDHSGPVPFSASTKAQPEYTCTRPLNDQIDRVVSVQFGPAVRIMIMLWPCAVTVCACYTQLTPNKHKPRGHSPGAALFGWWWWWWWFESNWETKWMNDFCFYGQVVGNHWLVSCVFTVGRALSWLVSGPFMETKWS